jgi:hypothetical protein
MIGGVDIVVELPYLDPSAALDAAVRYILEHWPAGILQRGDTGERLDRYAAIHFGDLHELFVYKDASAFESWERLGADPSNANEMVHLLASRGQFTIVVDSMQDATSASIVRGLRNRLLGIPLFALSQYAYQEAA